MKDLFVNSSYKFINAYKNLSDYDQIKIKYGLEVMYYFITKTLIILLIAFIFNVLKEVLIFNIFYIPLRSTAHGFHANSNIECWIITSFTYIFIGYFILNIYFNNISILILFIISVISFTIWSPADTKNLPLIRRKSRLKLKVLSLTLLVLETFISFFYFRNCIIISIIIQTLNINPIIYKLFKQKYNNYIDYQ